MALGDWSYTLLALSPQEKEQLNETLRLAVKNSNSKAIQLPVAIPEPAHSDMDFDPVRGVQPVAIYDMKSPFPFESIPINPTDSVFTGNDAMPQWPARYTRHNGMLDIVAGVIVDRAFSYIACKIMLAMHKEISKRPGVTLCTPVGKQLPDGRYSYSLHWIEKESPSVVWAEPKDCDLVADFRASLGLQPPQEEALTRAQVVNILSTKPDGEMLETLVANTDEEPRRAILFMFQTKLYCFTFSSSEAMPIERHKAVEHLNKLRREQSKEPYIGLDGGVK